MKRILAHKIIYRDKEYTMSVATFEDDKLISIEPFKCEIEATTFISGTIKITETQGEGIKITRI